MFEINSKKFSPREIDVLACIIHNRAEKKIAYICNMSHRTVSAHVRNIMGKIGCHNKDAIIDFIESSGKIEFFKTYYKQLLLRAEFEKLIIHSAKIIKPKKITIIVPNEKNSEIDESLLKLLYNHLKLGGHKILDKFDKGSESINIDVSKLSNQNYFDFVISIILANEEKDTLQEQIEKFKIYAKNINGLKETHNNQLNFWKNRGGTFFRFKQLVFVTIIIISFVVIWAVYDYWYKSPNYNTKNYELISELEEFIKLVDQEGFSPNNLNSEQHKKNQSIIKKIEKILEYKNIDEVKKYLASGKMTSELLLRYIYNLHSLALYCMYNSHNGKDAREILTHAKIIMENYVNVRSAISTNFDTASPPEILNELAIIQNLPEMYIRIVYALGRTYIYDGSKQNGTKYFLIAKELGTKLNLFEGYLANVSGLYVIDRDNIKKLRNHEKHDNEELKENYYKIIEKYTKALNDSNTYILDFDPGAQTQKTIIPSENKYNNFMSINRILESYKEILKISKDSSEREEINNKIISLIKDNTRALFGDKNIQDIINNKFPLEISQRVIAGFYNIVGEIFLIFAHNNSNCDAYYKKIIKIIPFPQPSDPKFNKCIMLAEQSFLEAKSLSRNSDYTKADAYKGLAMVGKAKLESSIQLSIEEQKIIQSAINDSLSSAELINFQLNRNLQ